MERHEMLHGFSYETYSWFVESAKEEDIKCVSLNSLSEKSTFFIV